MADLTTINASISATSLAVLVGSEFGFGPVPRVVVFEVRCASVALNLFDRSRRLRRPLKACFRIFKVSPMSLTARSTFTSVTSKTAGTATIILIVTAVLIFEGWCRHRTLTLILSISESTRSWRINSSRPPQTILGSIILQRN